MGKMVTNKQEPYKTCCEFYKNLYGTPQPFTKDIEFKRRFFPHCQSNSWIYEQYFIKTNYKRNFVQRNK